MRNFNLNCTIMMLPWKNAGHSTTAAITSISFVILCVFHHIHHVRNERMKKKEADNNGLFL